MTVKVDKAAAEAAGVTGAGAAGAAGSAGADGSTAATGSTDAGTVIRADAAATRLRREISAGDFAPGEKLNEVAVAARLGVSRNTLREAYAMLAAEGVVERIPYRGVFLVTPTPADVDDLYRVRATVEPACLLWGDDPDTAELQGIVAEARESLEAGDLAAVAACNQRFHRRIVATSGAPSLAEFSDRMLARMRLVFLLVTRFEPDFHADYVEQNARVTELVAAGDREGAAAALRESLLATAQRIIAILESAESTEK
ncbi:GntR family transcriptional regulator [Corynebacterium frankenforstense]|uniref:GntR family transcriptional regulator n=1 Tax=Corynebacterium frankenforstense TaxID=1230998 RepID=UPI001FEB3265|nr:GntR family transcriptional regulator [Corynebacterium frankenforstense]